MPIKSRHGPTRSLSDALGVTGGSANGYDGICLTISSGGLAVVGVVTPASSPTVKALWAAGAIGGGYSVDGTVGRAVMLSIPSPLPDNLAMQVLINGDIESYPSRRIS